jgi:hypothetical protein
MKFDLETAGYRYDNVSKTKLQKLGFRFSILNKDRYNTACYHKKDYTPSIVLNTLDDLLNIVKNYGKIIVYKDKIIIYDDYME